MKPSKASLTRVVLKALRPGMSNGRVTRRYQSRVAAASGVVESSKALLKGMLLYGVLAILLLFILFPVVAAISLAFKSQSELLMFSANPLPHAPTLQNFQAVFVNGRFVRYLLNSILISSTVTLLSIIFATFGGYALARFRFPGRRVLARLILFVYMFPGSVLVVPLFITLYRLNLIDTHYALILSYTTFSLPFCVWMLKGFFDNLPSEIEDAAMVDGCSRTGLLTQIVIPLSGPGIAAVGAFSFVLAWSEYLFAITFINSDNRRTVAAGLQLFKSQLGVDFGLLMAASVVAMTPVIIVFVLLQKYLIAGLTAGSVKG